MSKQTSPTKYPIPQVIPHKLSLKFTQKHELTLKIIPNKDISTSKVEQSPNKVNKSDKYQEKYVAYIGEIKEDVVGKCSLSSLEEVKEYLEENQEGVLNYRLNLENKSFVITALTLIRGKKGIVDLAEIPLTEVMMSNEPKDFNSTLTKIIKMTSIPSNLADNQIKCALKQLSQIVLNILNSSQSPSQNIPTSKPSLSQDQILQPIISKIVRIGQRCDHLQHRISENIQLLKLTKISNQQAVTSCQVASFQIEQLKGKINDLENTFRKGNKLLKQEMQRMDQQMENMKKQYKDCLVNEREKIDKSMNEVKEYLWKQVKKMRQELQTSFDKISKISQQLQQQKQKSQILSKQNTSLKVQKPSIKQQQLVQSSTSNILTQFNFPQKQVQCYSVEGTKIQRIESQKISENIGVAGKIPIKQKNIFKYKIVKTDVWGITVGIKDVLSNKVIKYGGNGWISNCQDTIYSQGRGIITGDIVDVEVNIQEGQVKWSVANALKKYNYKTKCNNKLVKDPMTFWVPYIRMSNGDKIEIV